jgi:hypothetical protein
VYKVFFLFAFILNSLLSAEVKVVPIATKPIDYKNKIYSYNLKLVQANEKYKCKEYLDVVTLKKNKYYAKHYISEGSEICLKDVYIPKINKVKFRFGNLEIEKEAELIKETKSYIKIKNLDGTIEKIYKDGRN